MYIGKNNDGKREDMMYNTVLFDLDGTLTDPGIGITNSVIYALGKLGITVEDRTLLYKFIGPPLNQSFMEFYGFDREKAEEAVAYYREYYKEKGIFENRVYEGIPELLECLKEEGKILLIATSKPEPFARQIAEHFGLAEYFDIIAGSDFEGVRDTKGKVIAYALEQCRNRTQAAVMVGDRFHDIEGAKENHIDSIGVLFGYGTKEELEQAGADHIAECPKDIAIWTGRR